MQTNHCIVCFKLIKSNNLHLVFNNQPKVCSRCLKSFDPQFIKYHIDDVKALAIYPYNEKIKEELFLFKGCKDYVLKDAFLDPFKFEIKVKFKGFYIVPIPSYGEHDLKRGFNHVEEIFKTLNLKMLKVLEKTSDVKQANKSSKERLEIGKSLKFIGKETDIRDRKILIVDDVCTTGSSLKAIVKIIKNYHPKEIKILTVAKRILSKEEEKYVTDETIINDWTANFDLLNTIIYNGIITSAFFRKS